MANKKKKSERKKTAKRRQPVKGMKQNVLQSYQTWKQQRPKWLTEIKTSIDRAKIQKAKKLLDEQKLQKKLIACSNICDLYWSQYEIAFAFYRTFDSKRALKYCSQTFKIGKSVEIYNMMALIYSKKGECSLAIETLQEALKLAPKEISIWNNLASCLIMAGRPHEGIDLFRKAVAAKPDYKEAYSNLLLNLNYLHDVEISEIFEEAKNWAKNLAPTTLAYKNHENVLEPHRKLRIGYISPDIKVHSVMYFFDSLLIGHDRNKFEIYGYGDVLNPDNLTPRLIKKFDFYRNIKDVEDADAAEFIKSDAIDILVDLAGHTGRNRLGVLAYKPAPIQVTYLGYPNTTGMSQIDYRLTDAVADTPEHQQYYTEKLVFLPNGFLCFNPGDIQPPIRELPSSNKEYFLFGCFNNPKKINPIIVKTWINLLKSVPGSKLMLKFKDGKDKLVKEHIWNMFAENGLDEPQKHVMIFGPVSYEAHLDTYNSVDIALDTYPYNGTTTTCQALLMGVPVITLTGEHHASRVGLDILSRLDMQFFAAQTPEEYVKKAVALASKPEALATIRSTMRQRLVTSPLCNYGLITSDIENAYRKMWHDYCRSKGIEVTESESQPADYQARRYSPPSVVELLDNADKLYSAGQRAKAVKYAVDALDVLSSKNAKEKPPQQLLEKYGADSLQSLIFNIYTELISYSSYFAQQQYWKLYSKIKKIFPTNPEIELRMGLLVALVSKLRNEEVPEKCIELLEVTDSQLKNERSNAALGLAKDELKKLSMPYDLARIHLYPDLANITTYVLLEQGDWFEKSDLKFFRSIIRPDDTILDLGANVGMYSLSAAARTDGKVIAVEPASQTFELLNSSASQFSNMTAVNAAISDKPGTAFLAHCGTSENFRLSDNKQAHGEGENVPLMTVDDIARSHGIKSVDIIKMDVEGHELKALAGAEKIISKGSPIIFYEIKHGNDWHFELINAFEKLGYDSYFTLPDAKTLVKYNKDIQIDEYLLNMIAVRPQALKRFEEKLDVVDKHRHQNILNVTSDDKNPDLKPCDEKTESTESHKSRPASLFRDQFSIQNVENAAGKDSNRTIEAKRIIIASMPRSGSMWTYNVTRQLIRAVGNTPIPEQVPRSESEILSKAFKEPIAENQVYCVKTHSMVKPEVPDTLFIVTYRDIRDSVLSFMKFTHTTFENALTAVDFWIKLTDFYCDSSAKNILIVPYDDIISKSPATIEKIASFIGTDVSKEQITQIHEKFCRKSMERKIQDINKISAQQLNQNSEVFNTVMNKDGSVRVLDKATGFQTNHITSKKEGQWRTELTDDQKQLLMQRTIPWLQKYGFEL